MVANIIGACRPRLFQTPLGFETTAPIKREINSRTSSATRAYYRRDRIMFGDIGDHASGEADDLEIVYIEKDRRAAIVDVMAS